MRMLNDPTQAASNDGTTPRRFGLPLLATFAATVLFATSAVFAPAQATVIGHNGIAESGFGAIPGTDEIGVALFDLSNVAGAANLCDDTPDCLAKVFLPESENQSHVMSIDPPASVFSFAEYVVNFTENAFTDYHIGFENVDLGDSNFAASLVAISFDEDGNAVFGDFLSLVPDIQETENGFEAWLFFEDTPLLPIFDQFLLTEDGFDETLDESFVVLGIFGILNTQQDGPVTVTQYPSFGDELPEPATMALLGVGLIGLGLARRRKRAA